MSNGCLQKRYLATDAPVQFCPTNPVFVGHLPEKFWYSYLYRRQTCYCHNKIIIIDRETVITGSFNFTKAAEEKNAENVLIIRDKALAKVYIDTWDKHRGHSEP